MTLKNVVIDADELAKKEIKLYALPALLHYNLSYNKAIEIGRELNANQDIIKIGVSLMDLKLGEAFKKGILEQHVRMSAEASKDFLLYKVDKKTLDIILNCIEAHHGKVEFKYKEAEICANADCYRFIHPAGVFFYLSNLGRRNLEPIKIFEQAETKLDEKWNIISLEYVKNDLKDYYNEIKKLLSDAKSEIE